jgi:hypothetical protein
MGLSAKLRARVFPLLVLVAGSAQFSSATLVTQVSACLDNTPCDLRQGSASASESGTLVVGSDALDYNNSTSADYGVLHLASRSSFSLINGSTGGASGQAFANFQDVLTINDATLTGQTGFLDIQYDLDGTISFTGNHVCSCGFLQVIGRVFAPTLQNSVVAYFKNGDVSGTFVLPTHFEFTYGTPFTFYLGMTAVTGSAGVPGLETGTSSVDFSHTLTLSGLILKDANGNPVTGATIASDSGTQYGPNGVVPEPTTSTLMLSGLTALALFRLRRLSQASA